MPSLLIERKIEIHPIHLVSSEGTRQKHVGNYRSVTNNRKFYSEIKKIICIWTELWGACWMLSIYVPILMDPEKQNRTFCRSTSTLEYTFLIGVLVNASRFLVGELLRLFSFSRWKKPLPPSAGCAWLYPSSPPLRLSFTGFTFTKMPRFAICSALTRSRCTPSMEFQNKLIMMLNVGSRSKE